jgi:chromate transporter
MKILWELFITFLKVGSFTFGGGLAMIPVIRREAVTVRHWMDEEEIVDCFAIAQSVPGVLAINSSVYIGYKVKGLAGALCAALGVILPAFISIIVILQFLNQYSDNAYVQGAFEGIKAATVGLIFVTAVSMGKIILKGKMAYIIALVSFILIVLLQINAAWAIAFGGITGYVVYRAKRGSK